MNFGAFPSFHQTRIPSSVLSSSLVLGILLLSTHYLALKYYTCCGEHKKANWERQNYSLCESGDKPLPGSLLFQFSHILPYVLTGET